VDEEKIITRIARQLASEDPVGGLAERLPPSDLQSLMLHVYHQRSGQRTPADLLAQYERTAMVQPSTADPRTLVQLERIAFECAAAFEAVDLSPAAPLGINQVLGQIHQNNCLATIRSAEVMADPTTASALECARRRRRGETGTIRLCSRSRQLRLQPFDGPGYSPHFEVFSMVTAGRDRGSLAFEMESLREHLDVYLALLQRLNDAGCRFNSVTVAISDTARDGRRLEQAQREVFEPLRARYPDAAFRVDLEREQARRYYDGLCLSLHADDREGRHLNLADGGFTDWTRRLLSNAKERLLVSGLGMERIAKCFCLPS
jgi:hypothetical protein